MNDEIAREMAKDLEKSARVGSFGQEEEKSRKSVVDTIVEMLELRKAQAGYKKVLEQKSLKEVIKDNIKEKYDHLTNLEILDNHREDIIVFVFNKFN